MPRYLIDSAEQAFEDIERGASEHVVLHGDLHHENILFDQRSGWVAIDPKGVIGPHCLEMARYLLNYLPEDVPLARGEEVIRARLDVFAAELGYPWRTLAACGLVDCILGLCWAFEEEGDLGPYWQHGVQLAHVLQRLFET
jgi:streptomycin 6-kinase